MIISFGSTGYPAQFYPVSEQIFLSSSTNSFRYIFRQSSTQIDILPSIRSEDRISGYPANSGKFRAILTNDGAQKSL